MELKLNKTIWNSLKDMDKRELLINQALINEDCIFAWLLSYDELIKVLNKGDK